jgi:hypothetical protein
LGHTFRRHFKDDTPGIHTVPCLFSQSWSPLHLYLLTSLSSWLYWEDPFPAIIKKRLHESWPDAKLFIEPLLIGFRTDDEEVQANDLNLLKSLVDCRNIHSVKVEIEYEHPVTMRWLKDVLLSSPKLNILHLTLPRGRDGKPQWPADGLGFYDLCVQQGDRLSPLTELVYETRIPFAKDEQSVIPASFFDFSQIHHLELRGPIVDRFLMTLKDQSLHMETLIIEYLFCPVYLGREVLEDFMSRIRGVKTLRIISLSRQAQLPISTVFALRDTLMNLEIRFARNVIDKYEEHSYPPEDLDDLRMSCPQISSLVLQMQIYNTLVSTDINLTFNIYLKAPSHMTS